jgi:hypothetical protein
VQLGRLDGVELESMLGGRSRGAPTAASATAADTNGNCSGASRQQKEQKNFFYCFI